MAVAPRSPIDPHAPLRRSRAVAWSAATLMVSLVVVEAGALAWLSLRRSVTMSVSLIDPRSGRVEAARPAQPEDFSDSFNVVQSCLVQYVLSRETFDATDLTYQYRRTRKWSTGKALQDYERLMTRRTAESPLNVYAPGTVLGVSVLDVSQIKPGVALVRFETRVRKDGNAPSVATAWITAVNYTFSTPSATDVSGVDDPTGFLVTRYQRDRESDLQTPSAKLVIDTPALRPSITAVGPPGGGQGVSSSSTSTDGALSAVSPPSSPAEPSAQLQPTNQGDPALPESDRKELAPPAPLPLASPQGGRYPLLTPPS